MKTLITTFLLIAGLIAIIIIGVVVLLSTKKRSKSDDLNDEKKPWPLGVNENFLSAAEQSFFYVLKQFVDKQFVVCPKVSLNDVVFIQKGTDNSLRQSLFNKISRKHIDFVLLDPETLIPALVVELDDSSHRSNSAQKRDSVKDKALKDAGLRLVRIPAKSSYTAIDFEKVFQLEILENKHKTGDDVSHTELVDRSNKNEINETSEPPLCPKCNVQMVMRKASKGKYEGLAFWGCSNYPNCRETITITSDETAER